MTKEQIIGNLLLQGKITKQQAKQLLEEDNCDCEDCSHSTPVNVEGVNTNYQYVTKKQLLKD